MVFFADLMQDHEKVISHMLQNNQFEEAIRKLENVVSKCTVTDLYLSGVPFILTVERCVLKLN